MTKTYHEPMKIISYGPRQLQLEHLTFVSQTAISSKTGRALNMSCLNTLLLNIVLVLPQNKRSLPVL